jgi:hypothetical protein
MAKEVFNVELLSKLIEDLNQFIIPTVPNTLRIKMRVPSYKSTNGFTYRDVPLELFDRIVAVRTVHESKFTVFAFFKDHGIVTKLESVRIDNILDMELIFLI